LLASGGRVLATERLSDGRFLLAGGVLLGYDFEKTEDLFSKIEVVT